MKDNTLDSKQRTAKMLRLLKMLGHTSATNMGLNDTFSPLVSSTIYFRSNINCLVPYLLTMGAVCDPVQAGHLPLISESTEVDKKRLVGRLLYHQIWRVIPQMAPKITGMLLENEESSLWPLLGDHHALMLKIHEALAVLKSAMMSKDYYQEHEP